MDNGVIRVWGTADRFDIEFSKDINNRWYATVPPDLTDGQYAVSIYALNSYDETAYWAGILYMHSGKATLKIEYSKYKLWLKPPMLCAELSAPQISITLKEVC